MSTEWFLIANAARGFIAQRCRGQPLTVIAHFEHPASRLKSAALGEDKAGRALAPAGFGGAAFEPRADAQRKEHLRFAHELATHLEEAALVEGYDTLVLFAGNPFLGELKGALAEATLRRLAHSVPVDLTRVGQAELGRRIADELAAAS
ncbi:host attachment protein [Hydrogenophaga sp. BPS33]|uniref:host attachment protein n=1 Tax=Hydrogenophaga sp. BPS33 TaxID=2651974 RepID=UPI00131F83E2|nr:host attachment protein [Hydrogenophaga sp. BPS33]QHE86248.1 host attachment protein [Hydrogenophaga sp. BPS33]